MRSGSHDTSPGSGSGHTASHASAQGVTPEGEVPPSAGEQKYRALFQAIDECFSLCELVRDADGRVATWRYLEINPALEAESGIPRAAIEGKLRSAIAVDSDDKLLPLFEQVVDRGEPVSFEYLSTNSRRYEVTAFSCGGQLFGILSKRVGQFHRQRLDEAMRESGSRQAFLLALSDALRPLLEPAAIQDATARLLAQHLGVARCYYAEYDEDRGTATIHRDFVRPGLPSMCGTYPVTDLGPIIETLRSGRAFMTNDWLAEPQPPPARAGIPAYGMRAHLVLPLAKGGRVLATLTVSHSAPREWTRYDLAIVEETAERTWAAVERANVEAALKVRETQLAFLDEISQMMAVAAPEGEIMNKVSERIAAHLHLTHCTFLDVDAARSEVTTSYGWLADQPPRQMTRSYRIADYLTPEFERGARAGETMVCVNTEEDQRTDSLAYASLGILAFVTVPFHREGEWKFLLAAGDGHPREWTAGEVQLLRQLSERVFPRIERARAEKALRDSEAHYHSLFEMMDEGFAVGEVIRNTYGRAVDYKIVELNRAYEKQTGLARDKVIGRSTRELNPQLDAVSFREFASVVDTGQPTRFETYVVRMDRWFHVRAFSRGADRFGILFDDITSRKQAAEEDKRAHAHEIHLREAANEANRAKDEFMALLGHELRNPLTPILATLDLMRMQGKKVFVNERALIERQARHLARLVDDLLDVTRIARGKVKLVREPVEIGGVISRAVETVSPVLEEKGHRLSTSIEPGLIVEGDADRLVQVVGNLLANAAKYTQAKGSIEVRGLAADDGGVIIQVSDNGGGIPGNLLPHVFDLFRQGPQASDRAQGGLGLGLAIVRNIAELHGGRVGAASEGPRKGSTFTVWLPRADRTRKAVERPLRRRRAASDRANGHRILVVDDNRDSTEVLALLLTRRGYEVEVAHDAVAGLKGALAFRPTVALLDIGLPEMDGYELARRLKAKRALRDVRLIAVTGYGQPADRERAFDAGFSEHVTKPFEFERLAELIEEGKGDVAVPPQGARRSAALRAPREARRAPPSKRRRSRR